MTMKKQFFTPRVAIVRLRCSIRNLTIAALMLCTALLAFHTNNAFGQIWVDEILRGDEYNNGYGREIASVKVSGPNSDDYPPCLFWNDGSIADATVINDGARLFNGNDMPDAYIRPVL